MIDLVGITNLQKKLIKKNNTKLFYNNFMQTYFFTS
jgi:hypothetical protein